jgi:hypothetical protein
MISTPRTAGQQPLIGAGAEVKTTADRCIHCGSARTQEARRSIDAVIFRCLHCWKTFTRAAALEPGHTDPVICDAYGAARISHSESSRQRPIERSK